jgi:hypothetical protein
VKECISGVADFYCATPPFMADEIDVWYDAYVQLEDNTASIYSGARGGVPSAERAERGPRPVSFLVAFVPYVAKKRFGRKRHKTHKRRTCHDDRSDATR